MAASRDHLLTLPCRYGTITFPRTDEVVGASLQAYGEWAQAEIDLLLELTPVGGTVIDAGAFIGTHTLALAGKVGPQGRVVAIEAQPAIRALLAENVEQNGLGCVQIVEAAIDRQPGVLRFPRLDLAAAVNFASSRALTGNPEAALVESVEVEATTIDELATEHIDLIKADLEGMEVPALEGALRVLSRDRPHLYLECSAVSNGFRILEFLKAHGYRAFMHRALAFNPDNYFGNEKRLFGLARETNLLAVAEERVGEVRDLIEQSTVLVKVDDLDDLAFLHLTTARWGEPEWSTLSKPGLIARLTGLLQEQERLEEQARQARLAQKAAAEDAARSRAEVSTAATGLADETARLELELERLRSLGAEEGEEARRTLDDAERQRAEEAEKAAAEVGTLRLLLAALATSHSAAVTTRPPASVVSAVAPPARKSAAPGSGQAPDWVIAIIDRLRDSPLHDPAYYLERNPDVRDADLDPLLHYVLRGASEGRDPHPLFDTSYYLDQVPKAATGESNPLDHFITHGFRRGFDPHPLFLTRFYLEQAPECRRRGLDPLTHYVIGGDRQGFDPHPLFDSRFYLARHPDLESSEVSPLAHFLLRGAVDGSDPHPLFSCADYLGMRPELAAAGVDPLLDFVTAGRDRGFLPRRLFDLANDKHVLTELDRLRHDGRRVVLFVSGEADSDIESSMQALEAVVHHHCVALRLRPAEPRIFGEAARGLVTLTAMGGAARGLLFDPRDQRDKLVTVLRGLGVTRVHAHQAAVHPAPVRDVLAALALPIDLSPSDDDLAGTGRRHPEREPPARQGGLGAKLKHRLRSFAAGAGAGRSDSGEWLVSAADRILVPSTYAARSFSRRWPRVRPIVAPPPDPIATETIEVVPPRLRADQPFRVVVVWEAIQHDEPLVVQRCMERLRAREVPFELAVVGSSPSRLPTRHAAGFGGRRGEGLAELLGELSPDAVWFPGRRPASYSRGLHEALRTGLPLMVADVGSSREQVAGRPWTWVVAGNAGAGPWCETLLDVRARLLAAAPPPPPRHHRAHDRFYPDLYLAARGLR